ncbi:polysaccharide pyruvyl transferase family protein [Aurantimonas sp. A3-2-R12]|uniref:polysaccharide pyruvyl transferase family protein n=1 Tax=Aurantimonas sp. A3-2-R12 TaxID=3114362 RepID=UPI002E196B6F|nr:polysaccharide pyruvyl transferase family protein [Aurantimonas sp. A3-2-R12]
MVDGPKAGIVTLQDVPNYGAALQAFALKSILGQFAQADVVNYHNRHASRDMELIRSARTLRQFMGTAKDLFRLASRRRTLERFRDFQSVALDLGPRLSASELKSRREDGRDAYVCGSDQIWNPNCVTADGTIDPVYFLDFARHSRKIAYAASIGHYKFNAIERKQIRSLLADFSAISVREAGAVDIIEPLVEKEVVHVLDPTLLIDRNGWEHLLPASSEVDPGLVTAPYVLVYSVPKSQLVAPAAEHFSVVCRSRTVCIEQDPFHRLPFATTVSDAGPLEFLTLWSKARFVVTDSFHGVCFSIIFNKPFVAVSPGVHSSRIVSLLTMTGLMHRYALDRAGIAAMSDAVDFAQANEVLDSERSKSVAFLRKALLD